METQPLLEDQLVLNTNNGKCVCVVCNLLQKGFFLKSVQEKIDIISSGRPTVPIDLQTKVNKSTKKFTRYFHMDFYEKYEWLTGCSVLSKLFCWPCLLFNTSERTYWNSVGITDLNNFHKSLKRHICSRGHLTAIFKQKTFDTTCIERGLESNLKNSHKLYNERVKKNRNILKRLIDATCFLGGNEVCYTSNNETSPGIYSDLLDLLGKYDETLRNHINESVFRSTSNQIQNDLVKSTADVVLGRIKEEIKEAPFIFIRLDETTTDLTNSTHLSVVVRYLLDGVPKERFIRILDSCTDRSRTAEDVFTAVCDIVEDLECGSKLVAQSYDGATVVPSHLETLQTKLKEKYCHAFFVHCLAHRLDLVLSQGLGSIKECKIFFSTLTSMASFFSKSSRRTRALNAQVQERFPNLASTLCENNGRLVETVFECRDILITFFQSIWDNKEEWDAETIAASKGYLHCLLEDTEFDFLLNIFATVFPLTDGLFDILQAKSDDIGVCIKQIDEVKKELTEKREQFDRFWQDINNTNNEETEEPESKRIKIENDGDKTLSYRLLYMEIFYNVIQQLRSRFQTFIDFKFVELCNFNSYSSQFPTEALNCLKFNYGNLFDVLALHPQLSLVYDKRELSEKNNPLDLLTFLKRIGLDKALYEVVKLCQLVLTIPATRASIEHSSSTLTRIKNCIKNATGEGDVSNVVLLSIEKEYIKELCENPKFYDDVIDKFAAINKQIELQ